MTIITKKIKILWIELQQNSHQVLRNAKLRIKWLKNIAHNYFVRVNNKIKHKALINMVAVTLQN